MGPAAKRFSLVTHKDIVDVLEKRVTKSTKETTSTWFNMFSAFLVANCTECNLESCTLQHLNDMLGKCYMSMKRKDGGFYQEPGYLGFWAAVQRELNKHERKFNIYKDMEFKKSNDILDGMLK